MPDAERPRRLRRARRRRRGASRAITIAPASGRPTPDERVALPGSSLASSARAGLLGAGWPRSRSHTGLPTATLPASTRPSIPLPAALDGAPAKREREAARLAPRARAPPRARARRAGRREAARRSSSSAPSPPRVDDVDRRAGCPSVSVPVLSKSTVRALAELLDRAAPLTMTPLRAARETPGDERDRRREDQRARRGDDDHRQRADRRRRCAAQATPGDRRAVERQEPARRSGRPCGRTARVRLGLADESHERRVGALAPRAASRAARTARRRSSMPLRSSPRRVADRQRLAGQRSLVDKRLADRDARRRQSPRRCGRRTTSPGRSASTGTSSMRRRAARWRDLRRALQQLRSAHAARAGRRTSSSALPPDEHQRDTAPASVLAQRERADHREHRDHVDADAAATHQRARDVDQVSGTSSTATAAASRPSPADGWPVSSSMPPTASAASATIVVATYGSWWWRGAGAGAVDIGTFLYVRQRRGPSARLPPTVSVVARTLSGAARPHPAGGGPRMACRRSAVTLCPCRPPRSSSRCR